MRVKIKRILPESERKISDPVRAREKTMNRAIRLLAAKPRSVNELRDRLLEKEWTNEAIVKRVISKLEEYGYLDDQKFADDLAVSRLRQKPQGKRRLELTLSRKKLDKKNIEKAITTAFDTYPEEDLINASIEKRIRIKGHPNTRLEKKKFFDHLLRQGFGFDLIRSKMSSISNKNQELFTSDQD